ncbi:MAG: SDR family NAD(P)-dependent oxidoreductase [bacterium]
MNLSDKRVLVTGGGSGIGLALAEALVLQGCRVAICGRNPDKLQAAARQVPLLLTAVCDVRQPEDVAALDRTLQQAWGGIDLLVNNAGVADAYMVQHAPHWLAQAEREIETNLLGPLRLTNQFLPQLLTRPEAAIVNVTSGLALEPSPAAPGYSAAKAGLHAFTRVLRRQLRGTTVRVVEVQPPMVDTPMVADSRVHKVSPAAVAAATVRGLERNRQEIPIGEVRLMKWGLRLIPWAVAATLEHHPFQLKDAVHRRPPA